MGGDDSGIDTSGRVALRVRLAWLASIAGQWDLGAAKVAEAHALLGPDPVEKDVAAINAVAAHLALDMPGADRLTEAESLARAAVAATERVPAPVVACQAWYAISVVARERDLDESNACFERMRVIAEANRLPIWRTYGRTGPATNTWLADGDVRGLVRASDEALRVGAINVANSMEAVRTLHTVLCGDFTTASDMLAEQLTTARRLKSVPVERYLLMTTAVAAAHQGRQREMEDALDQFRERGGERSREHPLALGMARAFHALLVENIEEARHELELVLASQRANPTTFYLAGKHGLYPLLLSLTEPDRVAEFTELSSVAVAGMRWNRQFVELGRAVLFGRQGRIEDAVAAVDAAEAAASCYPVAHMLGLRLIAETAHTDGWGQPAVWLRRAEDFFHQGSVPALADACRSALRRIGAPAPQRRVGTGRVSGSLRQLGVTLREYEVFELLVDRLGNKEIGSRLHISPRTVEKHVASLLSKTGRTNRTDLITYATVVLAQG
jgi:DNA-binding CsgD family transcriptional regulator